MNQNADGYQNINDYLDACDKISLGRFGEYSLDLIEDSVASSNAIRSSFANRETPDQAVANIRHLQAEEMWNKLRSLPCNSRDEITEPFSIFSVGTDFERIRTWLEISFYCSIENDQLKTEKAEVIPFGDCRCVG